ncbi:MAG: YbaB/EbfC family nucleoid-associated protein [Oscillospiraceae bacterium]
MAKGYSARKGFSGGAGMMQQQAQMQQKLMKMQQEMSKAQEEVENSSFTASRRRRRRDCRSFRQEGVTALTIKPDVVDPEDVEMLRDLVISAVNEALRQAEEAMSSSMNALTGGLNIPGLGL